MRVAVCVGETHKGEVGCVLAQQPGEDRLPLDALLLLEHVAVHEAVEHGGVGVDVDVKLQAHRLEGGNRRMKRETKKKEEEVSGENGTFFFLPDSVSGARRRTPLGFKRLSLLWGGRAGVRLSPIGGEHEPSRR